MTSFLNKTKITQPATPTRTKKTHQAFTGLSREVEPIFNLQHSIGNRAVQRLLTTDLGETNGGFTQREAVLFGFNQMPGQPAGGTQTRDFNGEASEQEVTTLDGDSVPSTGETPASPTATAEAECRVLSGPTYSPSGTVSVTNSGGRKRAPFSFTAAFTPRRPGTFALRQYIKWDQAFQTWRGGPPHSGFSSSSTSDTWYEDRDVNDKRYGHRSGTHSDPIGGGGDEYTLGGTQDQINGDTYNGRDTPGGPTAMTGQFTFQLKVVDTANGDAEKASSPEIKVNW
jgi:hypothetical protein